MVNLVLCQFIISPTIRTKEGKKKEIFPFPGNTIYCYATIF